MNTVYGYITITPSTEDKDLKEVKIRFKVEKSWMKENNIDASRISLFRFSTKWDALPTSKIKEDESYVYHEGVSPDFSDFSIVALPAITTTTTITLPTTTTTLPPTKKPPAFPTTTIAAIVIAIVIVVLLILWYMKLWIFAK